VAFEYPLGVQNLGPAPHLGEREDESHIATLSAAWKITFEEFKRDTL
jgi:hypothetical protein